MRTCEGGANNKKCWTVFFYFLVLVLRPYLVAVKVQNALNFFVYLTSGILGDETSYGDSETTPLFVQLNLKFI